MKSILDFVPKGFILRPYQTDILLEVESIWNKYDVIAIDSPVGSGKSVIAQTIARWRESMDESTATIVHRVLLQDQYNDSFPDVPVLKGKNRYICQTDEDTSCEEHYEIFGEYCASCPSARIKREAKKSNNAVFNFHSYILHKAYKKNIIIDESHNVLPVMTEMYSIKLWRHKYPYPDNMNTLGDIAIWIEGIVKKLRKENEHFYKNELNKLVHRHDLSRDEKDKLKKYYSNIRMMKKLKLILEGLQQAPSNFFIEHIVDKYKNKNCPALSIKPTTLEKLPPILWPRTYTKKIVLMSGTINEMDLNYIGLKSRRTKIIKVANPIPAINRPIIINNPINMSYKYQSNNIVKMISHINTILDKHPNSKGIIHTTYGLADTMRIILNNKRVMTHTKLNKDHVFKRFLKKKDNSVLLACGMSEGIDLKGMDYEFQIIMKVIWPSQQDNFNRMLYNTDIKRIIWETAKTIRQQVGRICRGPTDKGVTYITDLSFGNIKHNRYGLFQQAKDFWGKDFIDSIIWE